MVTDIIKTRTASIWLDEQCIIHSVSNDDAELTLEDAIENLVGMKSIATKIPAFVLSDIRNISSASKEHRDYFSSEKAAEVFAAVAILISSPLSKVLGNIFLKINKPPFIGKLFTSETEAMKWLNELIAETQQ